MQLLNNFTCNMFGDAERNATLFATLHGGLCATWLWNVTCHARGYQGQKNDCVGLPGWPGAAGGGQGRPGQPGRSGAPRGAFDQNPGGWGEVGGRPSTLYILGPHRWNNLEFQKSGKSKTINFAKWHNILISSNKFSLNSVHHKLTGFANFSLFFHKFLMGRITYFCIFFS